MIYSAETKTCAHSEMSRIVAAACCVYFLLPFLLFQTARLCYLQASGLLTCPLWHVPSLKCIFDGTFVKHDNEGSPTPGQAEIRLHTDSTVQTCQCLYTFVVFGVCICRFMAVYFHVFPRLTIVYPEDSRDLYRRYKSQTKVILRCKDLFKILLWSYWPYSTELTFLPVLPSY